MGDGGRCDEYGAGREGSRQREDTPSENGHRRSVRANPSSCKTWFVRRRKTLSQL